MIRKLRLSLFAPIALVLIAVLSTGCSAPTDSDMVAETAKEAPAMAPNPADEVADLMINGVALHIPRKYIPFGRNRLDGVVEGVNLLFYLPDMRAAEEVRHLPRDAHMENATSGIIESTEKKITCFAGECRGHIQSFLQNRLRAPLAGPPICLTQAEFREDLGLWFQQYLPGRDENDRLDVFFTGAPCAPDDYLICRVKSDLYRHPSCTRFVVFRNSVLITYSFSKTQLASHRAIAQAWQRKLNEFTANNNNR